MDVIIITLFKATVATVFTIGLSFWFRETKKTYIAIMYWFLGLMFVFLNAHGVLNGLTFLLTNDYVKFNSLNAMLAFVIYVAIGYNNFRKI